MFCTKCGTNLADDSIFCHKCGRQVPSQSYAAETSLSDSNAPKAIMPKPDFSGLDKVADSDLPQPTQQIPAATAKKRMSAIKLAWKGEERLWKVFWLYNILGTFVIWFMQKVAVSLESVGASDNGFGRFFTILFGALTTTYFIWAITSLWRCAFNTGSKVLGYLGRVFVIWVFVSFLAIVVAITVQHK